MEKSVKYPGKVMEIVRKDRGLNILLYEKQTGLINSLLYAQRMREGQPSFKGFCDVSLKL